MPDFMAQPVLPFRIDLHPERHQLQPEGPTLVRRMSDLAGLFRDEEAFQASCDGDNPVVYEVASSPVPEAPRELPQSITTIYPGTCGTEFYMTKGHQHPDPQAEIYLGLSGQGGLLMFDGDRTELIRMSPGAIGYIPPGWAHRSINTGDEPYRFLAVYPGSAGHDYGWVLEHGMGERVHRLEGRVTRRPFDA